MARYRVTYVAQSGPGKGSVTLSEIVEDEDLQLAFNHAKGFAAIRGWELRSVEELDEEALRI